MSHRILWATRSNALSLIYCSAQMTGWTCSLTWTHREQTLSFKSPDIQARKPRGHQATHPSLPPLNKDTGSRAQTVCRGEPDYIWLVPLNLTYWPRILPHQRADVSYPHRQPRLPGIGPSGPLPSAATTHNPPYPHSRGGRVGGLQEGIETFFLSFFFKIVICHNWLVTSWAHYSFPFSCHFLFYFAFCFCVSFCLYWLCSSVPVWCHWAHFPVLLSWSSVVVKAHCSLKLFLFTLCLSKSVVSSYICSGAFPKPGHKPSDVNTHTKKLYTLNKIEA